MTARWLALGAIFFAACSSGDGTPAQDATIDTRGDASDEATVDTAVDASDATSDVSVDAKSACPHPPCDLYCDPADSWLALTRGPGTALGDPEPVSADESGDGQWHLFVGVDLSSTKGPGAYYVQIFDSTSSTAAGPYTLAATPLNSVDDDYDHDGKETPSYLRIDAHTEILYYTADTSISPPAASVAALKRVDHGAWTKLGKVAPAATNEIVQVDPTIVFDPTTKKYVLTYFSGVVVGSSLTASLVARTSADPTSFDPSTSVTVAGGSGDLPSRAASSFDSTSGVWRMAFDISNYPIAHQTLQTWSLSPIPPISALQSPFASELHDGAHASHTHLHVDATKCLVDKSCPQGAVLQPSKAMYPTATDVLFFYAGWSDAPGLQVNAQHCTRR